MSEPSGPSGPNALPYLCRVALRPRGPLEVFDLTLTFVRQHVGAFLWLSAVVVLPWALGAGIAAAATQGSPAWALVPLVLGPALQAPFTLLTGRLLFASDVTARQVLRELVGRPGAVVTVLGWALTGLVLSCGIGLPLTLTVLAFVPEVALLERPTGSVAVRAMRLAGYNGMIALASAAAFGVLTVWGATLGELVGQFLFGTVLQLGAPFGTAQDGVVTPFLLAGALGVQPIVGAYRVLLFVDLRTRVDGWDLQVGFRAAALASAEAELPAAGAGSAS